MNKSTASYDHYINAFKSERLRFLLILLFVFSLPFDRFYSTVILMLLIVCTFIDVSVEKIKQIPRQIWIFQAVFFLTCLGYGYSYNKHEAGFMLEKQLAILAFPLILPLAVRLTPERIRPVMISLTVGSLISILYLFINVVYIILLGNLPFSLIFSKEFFNHGFSAPLEIHAGYLSLYISFSIIFLLGELVAHKQISRRLFLIACLSVLTAGLFFLASRNSIITTVLVICIIFPLFHVKRKLLFYSIISALLISVFFVVHNVNYLNERFSSDMITDINSDLAEYNFDGAEPRIERWKAALELFPGSPLIGYGTGDEIGMLKTKYVEKQLFISYLESFNAHNQYLSYLLKNGIIGLIAFLAAMCYYLMIAIRARHFIYISFLISMMIGFFTENILDANKGIYFFALFNTLLGYTLLKTDKDVMNTGDIKNETEKSHKSFS